MRISEALRLYAEGRDACNSGRNELPYDESSQEARWWAKGWLETYRKAH